MNLEHNHELITDPKLQEASLENRNLNEEQLDNIKLMVKHKMPSKKLKGLIEEQYGKKLSDKDLQNIDLLKKYFPQANILLCTFHVIKYLKGVVADYESKENKQDVMDIISKMVYCKDDNEYQQLLQHC